jgi:hypothetical protein
MALTWSVEGGTKVITRIDDTGKLTVASDEPVDTVLTVKATYTSGELTLTGTATATVKAP